MPEPSFSPGLSTLSMMSEPRQVVGDLRRDRGGEDGDRDERDEDGKAGDGAGAFEELGDVAPQEALRLGRRRGRDRLRRQLGGDRDAVAVHVVRHASALRLGGA